MFQEEKKQVPPISLLCFYVWVVLGTALIGFLFIDEVSTKWEAKSWPVVTGQVVHLETTGSSRKKGSNDYGVTVQYQYFVKGKEYRSSYELESSWQNDIRPIIERLSKKPSVPVYYNPDSPAISFLIIEVMWSDYLAILSSFVVVPMCGAAFVSAWKKRKSFKPIKKPHGGWFFLSAILTLICFLGTGLGTIWFCVLSPTYKAYFWPIVDGVVTYSNVKTSYTSLCKPVIHYNYIVTDKKYTSSQIYPKFPLKTPAENASFVNRFPVGATVPVYYNANNPVESYIVLDISAHSFIPSILVFSIGLPSFVGFVVMYRERKMIGKGVRKGGKKRGRECSVENKLI